MMTINKTPLALLPLLLAAALAISPRAASAQQRELLSKMGGRGTLAIDQVSGFRASLATGISYAGPLGFSHTSYSADSFANNGNSSVVKTTSLWFAPSADIFVIDHLSIGAIIELATTNSSLENRVGNVIVPIDLRTLTSVTLLPRVGYLIAIGDRFGIWPRSGIGYASQQQNSAPNNGVATRETISTAVLDFDLGFLYRFNETFFMRLAPEIAFSLGGSHSQSNGPTTLSANAGIFQLSAISGIGVMVDL